MSTRHRVIKGDVKKELPKLKTKFDRVVMPLPKLAKEFLKLAISKTKKGGIIHFYTFASKKELAKLRQELSTQQLTILRVVRCGAYSPGVDRYCFDLKIS